MSLCFKSVSTGGKFYDLGSGTGKVVLAAALLHDFSSCCGIELLRGLHGVAEDYGRAWEAANTSLLHPSLKYICGSILDMEVKDWAEDADVVFSNTHCFDADMMNHLSILAGVDNIRALSVPALTRFCSYIYQQK